MENIKGNSFNPINTCYLDIQASYFNFFGNSDIFINRFIDQVGNEKLIKAEFLDCVTKVSMQNVQIMFVVVNDSSVASRRYQESFICQTPLYYAYEDLVRLFSENIPKVRQRNSTSTYLEPLLPIFCAQNMILEALIYATQVDGQKNITLTLTSKSLKISYSFDERKMSKKAFDVKIEYFKVMGINIDFIIKAYNDFNKTHKTQTRFSYFNGIKTTEILFNVRKSTFKKYQICLDSDKLLSKAEYDIYNFIKDRGGASLALIADEFGYSSVRAALYHVNKLICYNLIELVGGVGSHNSFYRVK